MKSYIDFINEDDETLLFKYIIDNEEDDEILDDIDEKIVDELTLFFNPNKYAIAAPIISINWFEPSSEASP